MNKPTQHTLIYFSLAGITLLAGFLFLTNRNLRQQLAASQASQQSMGDSAQVVLQRLATIDSLLLAGHAEEARRAYEQLPLQPGSEWATLVQWRIRQLERFTQMQARLYQYEGTDPYRELSSKLLEKRQQIDSLGEQLATAQRQRSTQVDSMRFALEKAQMHNEVLQSQVANLVRVGYLTFTNQGGEQVYYVGEVSDQQANGWGVGLSESGIRYEGEWKDNQHHGQGVLHWPDQEYYEGSFRANERHGHGNYYWPDGEMFSGEWKDDQRNGPGVFYDEDGNIMTQGTWQDNELVKVKVKVKKK